MQITLFQGYTIAGPVLSGSSAPSVAATSGPMTDGPPAKTQTVDAHPLNR